MRPSLVFLTCMLSSSLPSTITATPVPSSLHSAIGPLELSNAFSTDAVSNDSTLTPSLTTGGGLQLFPTGLLPALPNIALPAPTPSQPGHNPNYDAPPAHLEPGSDGDATSLFPDATPQPFGFGGGHGPVATGISLSNLGEALTLPAIIVTKTAHDGTAVTVTDFVSALSGGAQATGTPAMTLSTTYMTVQATVNATRSKVTVTTAPWLTSSITPSTTATSKPSILKNAAGRDGGTLALVWVAIGVASMFVFGL